MEKVVHKFAEFSAADEADEQRYRGMTGEERLAVLVELLWPEGVNEANIQRSARVYPLAESGRD